MSVMKLKNSFLVGALTLLTSSIAAQAVVEVAKVNGKSITDRDVIALIDDVNEGQQKSLLKDPNNRRQLVGTAIDQELLVQDAEKQKIDQDPEVKVALDAFRKQLLASKVLEKNLASKINEAEAKKYYSSNKIRYNKDVVQVMHILVDKEDRARELLAEVKKPNADFQALAEKHSKDPSAKSNRGDLGVITRDGPFVPEFKDAAFAAKKDDIVGPVKTLYGYHILKIADKKVGTTRGYDEVENQVKGELKQKLIGDYVSRLKASAKVELNEAGIGKL